MFPLTFKFGPENSNAIFIVTSIVVIVLFFLVFFVFIMPNINESGSMTDIANSLSQFIIIGVYGLIGILSMIISYILSIKIFNKQEL